MNYKLSFFLIIFLFIGVKISAQNNMGVGTLSPDPSSIVDLSATDKGFLVPRMNSADRVSIVSPALGLLVFDIDFNQFWFFDGTIWVQAIGPQGPAGPQGIPGTNGVDGATGPQGPAGNDGADGAQGPTGANGTNGVDGVQGATGPQGPAGANGADGAQGPIGANGTNGSDGAQGPTGPQGPAGNNGTDGAQGATGPAGANGANGSNGAQGPTGPAGANGSNGSQGPAGANGAQGTTGPAGPVGCGTANMIIKSNGSSAVCSQIFDNGNFIGIGTTAPANPFHYLRSGGTGVWQTHFQNSGTGDASFYVDQSNAASTYRNFMGGVQYTGTALLATGVEGYSFATGTATPGIGVRGGANTYEGTGVEGTRFNDGGADLGYGGFFYNDLGYTGFLYNFSDANLKKNIRPIENPIQKIMSLRGVNYEHDLEKYPNMGLAKGTRYGFVAQEVETVIPEFVKEKSVSVNACEQSKPGETKLENDRQNFKAVDYISLIPLMLEGMKEQQRMIEAQNIIIEELKLEIQKIKTIK